MRIIYLDADFASATGETGPRSQAMAQRLLARGHEVTILTSDRQFELPEGAARIFQTVSNGIPVGVINVGLVKGRSGIRRIWHHLVFAVTAAWFLLRTQRPDAIYVTSPPLSAVIPAVLAKWVRGVPFVLEVREIWPEVPHGIDLIRPRILYVALRRLALLGYRVAARVVALTEPAVHHIQADIPLARKVLRIGPSCDLDLFARGDGSAIRARQGWGNRFVCLHVGPMTRAAGLEAILRVADAVREDQQFVFWLVGNGDERAELQRNIQHRELPNVVLWDEVPRAQLPDVIAASDLCLMTARHFRVLEQASSDRLFEFLAAGRPVLLNYGGWQREFLETHQAGLGTALGAYGDFFGHICRMCDRPDLRAQMGRNARHVAETLCNPDLAADKVEEVLTAVVGPPQVRDERELSTP